MLGPGCELRNELFDLPLGFVRRPREDVATLGVGEIQ